MHANMYNSLFYLKGHVTISFYVVLINILTDCGNLTDPIDGSVNFTSTTYDSQARYNCKTGYSLFGSETSVCQANETWSDTAPICRIKCNGIDFV